MNIALLQDLLQQQRVGAMYLSFLPDIRWACGFTGSNGVLLVLPEQAHFITDGRYIEQARREVTRARVHTPGYELDAYIAQENLLGSAQRVLFQADHLTVARLEALQARFTDVDWVPSTDLLTRHVAAKTEAEVARMRRAQAITDDVFEYLLGYLRPGLREREVAAEIVYQHMRRGAEKMSFDPIVASGSHSALPHAQPTDKRLEEGALLLVDMGCFVDGYASDMTRTVALGRPTDDAKKVHAVVLEAQQRSLDQAAAGLSTKALDAVARTVIEEAGFGAFFTHSLGHGVGLQIHEWPRVSYQVDELLPENAVITIEPGIYLPDAFGVRIEDMVVLRARGHENLTSSSKELITL